MEEIYERNGKKYTRKQLEDKYGSKVDDAIANFGFKKQETERLKPVEEYEFNGQKFSRKQLEDKYGPKVDEVISTKGFKNVSPQQQYDNFGNAPEEIVQPEKKKENAGLSSQGPAMASSASTEVTSGSSVSGKSPEPVVPGIEDQATQETSIQIPAEGDKTEVGFFEDLWNETVSGITRTMAGAYGIKNFLNKQEAALLLSVMPDKYSEALNKMTPKQREIFINNAVNVTSPIGKVAGQVSIDAQNDLTAKTNEIAARTIRFEGNIIDDIASGNFAQAGQRTLKGVANSASSVALAVAPGGLLVIGAGTAAQKQETLEEEGEDINVRTVLNSTINGAAEGFMERYTAGIAKGTLRALRGKTEAAKHFSEGIVKTILKDMGIEAASEFATSIIQDLSDKIVQGRDISLIQIMKNAADGAIIGAAMGGGISAPKGLAGYVATKSMKKEKQNAINDKTAEAIQIENTLDNPELSDKVRVILEKKAEAIRNEVKIMQEGEIARAESMTDEQIKDLFQVDKEVGDIAVEISRIEESESIDPQEKESLIKILNSEFDAKNQQREQLQESEFEKLPAELKEQYLEEARELSKEYMEGKEPDGEHLLWAASRNYFNKINHPETYGEPYSVTETETEVSLKDSPKETIPTDQVETQPESEIVVEEEVEGAPKAVLDGKKITTKEGEVLDIEIYDAQYGKVENVTDRQRTDRFSMNVVDNSGEIPKTVGTLALWDKGDGTWFANIVDVNEKYRRGGIATAMYDYAEANGFNIVDSENQTDRGKAFKENRNKAIKPVQEKVNAPEATVEVKITDNGPTYTVDRSNGPIAIKDKNGKEPSAPTQRKILDKYSEQVDFTAGEIAKPVTDPNIDPSEYIARESNNPAEIAQQILNTDMDQLVNNNIDMVERAISENIGFVSSESFNRFGDRNLRNQGIGKTYLRKDGVPIDTFAQTLSEDYGVEITPQDIVDFIVSNPGGAVEVARRIKNEKIVPLQQRFSEITGLPANDKYLQKAVKQLRDKEIREEYLTSLDFLNNQELLDLTQDKTQFEKQTYGKKTNTSSENSPSVESGQENGRRSGIRQKDNEDGGRAKDEGVIEQASQARTNALVTERIKPEKRATKNSPKKLPEIIAKVAKDLKATLIYGRSGRARSIGTYSPSNTLVRIKNAGDLDTVAHELGHYLDDAFDIIGKIPSEIELAAIRQLKWFSERGGSNPPGKLSKQQKQDYLQREGLAELIRAFVANPTQANIVAPELLQHFENTIDKKTLESLKEFSDSYLDIANASYGERISSNVESSNLKDKGKFIQWLEGFKGQDGKFSVTWIDKFNAHVFNSWTISHNAFEFINELNGGEKLPPSKSFELMSRVFAGINGKVNTVLGKGLINGRSEVLKAEGGVFKKDDQGRVIEDGGTRMTVEWLMNGLDITSEKTLLEDKEEVKRLLIAERTMEYARKFGRLDNLAGIGAGIDADIDIAQGYLNEFNALEETNLEKFTRIREAAAKYRQFADVGLRYAVDKGRLSKEKYEEIKASNEYYVSMARVQENAPMDEVLDHLNEMGGKISSVKEIFHKAKGGTGFIQDPYVSLLKNTSAIIRESDRNEVLSSFIIPIKNQRNMGDGNPIDFSQIARPAQTGDKNTRTIYINGKPEKWQFDQNIFKSLTGVDDSSSNILIDIFSAPASLIRFTVTRFPTFAARNASRDTSARLIISRTKSGFRDMIQNASDQQVFEMYGGSQAGFYLTNKKAYREKLRETSKILTSKGNVILDPRILGKNYFKLLEKGENINRIAEFKSAYRKARREGLDDYEAGLYAAYQARDLMDFAVAGHTIRQINKFIPFLNAGIQGLRRTGKSIKENPLAFAAKTALYTQIPTLAVQVMAHAMGYEDEYEELPAHQRDLYWNFKLFPGMQGWVTIPKPFELGIISSVTDRTISKSKGRDNAFDGFTGTIANSLMPFDESSVVGGFKPIVETSANFNFFTERPIIPYWEEGKMIELRAGTKYASRLGKTVSEGFNMVGAQLDPRNVDHIVQGYGTYFGNWALSLSDIGRNDSRFKFNLSKTGFARDTPISNSVSVSAVNELTKELGKTNDKDIKILREYIEDYYESESPKEQAELTIKIYKYAEKLRKELETEKAKILNLKEKKNPTDQGPMVVY